MEKNILLKDFDTPYQTTPFDQIEPDDFLPAIRYEIDEVKKRINRLCSHETISFENTIEELEFSSLKLDRITSILYNLNSAETNRGIQEAAQEASPLLSALQSDIIQNEALFRRIEHLYKNKQKENLSPGQRYLLELTYRNFIRNGALLGQEAKNKLRKIDEELSRLKLTFGEHILRDTHSHFVHFSREEEVEGIPEQALRTARKNAESRQKDAWVFGLDYPSYHAVITYATNRESRRKMYLEYGKRGFRKDENNNEDTLLRIVALRKERAALLGYKTHAHFVLEERMAENPERVSEFLDTLFEKAYPAAGRDIEEIRKLAYNDGIETLQAWDVAFYRERLKKIKLDFDDAELKVYFPFEEVLKAVFLIANKLYGIKFILSGEIPVYHQEVKAYRVEDEKGAFLAVFYVDPFPRKGKRSGAWMTSYKKQWIRDGRNSRPHISIVCNFTPPGSEMPSLLTFREVTTLFHEFGHALHGMLSQVTYPSVSGTSVLWDFVELPSQIMENWAYEPEVLDLFARHYRTGEKISEQLLNKIKESRRFMEGYASLRQLSFGYLDMAWHYSLPGKIPKSVKEYEEKARKKTELLPEVTETCISTAFSHIFAGGYAAGYYSYKWAEVLEADAFELFKENGVFDTQTADSFKTHILSKGGSLPPMELYKSFRGKEPAVEALLRRGGLVEENE